MGRRLSDLHFHHTICVGCRLILRHNPSIRPALERMMLFPECVCYINPGAPGFSECCDSDLFNPIRGNHTPLANRWSPLFSSIFWGFSILETTSDPLSLNSPFNNSPHTLPSPWRVGGSQYSLMRLSFRKMAASSLQHWCGIPRTVSERHLLCSLSNSLSLPCSDFYFSWFILRSSSGSPGLQQRSQSFTSQH